MNPMDLALAVQELGTVEHHDFLDFNKLGGGIMNLVLPRDPPTIVMNQMPPRVFRIDGSDYEETSRTKYGSIGTYDKQIV